MEDENYVDSSKDAKHQLHLHLHKRREAYRTKREAETQVKNRTA